MLMVGAAASDPHRSPLHDPPTFGAAEDSLPAFQRTAADEASPFTLYGDIWQESCFTNGSLEGLGSPAPVVGVEEGAVPEAELLLRWESCVDRVSNRRGQEESTRCRIAQDSQPLDDLLNVHDQFA